MAVRVLKPGGVIWFSRPKKSLGVGSDITRDVRWEGLRVVGWRPVSQIAVGET